MTRALILAAVLALAACGSDPAPSPAPTDPASSPALARIRQLDDCGLLQAEFDTAAANGNVTFMHAADDRMDAVGCYG